MPVPKFPDGSSIPPNVGEYAYYHSKLELPSPHWLVVTDIGNEKHYGCHYSMPQEMHNQPFITCNGKITSVGSCIQSLDKWTSS